MVVEIMLRNETGSPPGNKAGQDPFEALTHLKTLTTTIRPPVTRLYNKATTRSIQRRYGWTWWPTSRWSGS